jgi:hypothetical protein
MGFRTHTKSLITSPVFVQITCRENGGYIHVQSIQHQLVMVVAPKAFNFGNLVRIEIRCGGDLRLISVVSGGESVVSGRRSSEITSELYTLKPHHRFKSS